MRIRLYQINPERDKDSVKFLMYSLLGDFQKSRSINASIYDEVFNGDVSGNDLEDVYWIFNSARRPVYRGHSLSVSDIIVVEEGTDLVKRGAYFCDNVGFVKVAFDSSKCVNFDAPNQTSQ